MGRDLEHISLKSQDRVECSDGSFQPVSDHRHCAELGPEDKKPPSFCGQSFRFPTLESFVELWCFQMLCKKGPGVTAGTRR